jgi:hypothetical protein
MKDPLRITGTVGADLIAGLRDVVLTARPAAALDRIFGGCGGIGSAGGRVPDQHAGFGLFEVPAFGLFAAMVAAAERGQVAFAGGAALVPGAGVVQVAACRGPGAARGGACAAAGADDVGEGPAGVVADLGAGMVAGPAGDRDQRGGEAGQGVRGPGRGGWPLRSLLGRWQMPGTWCQGSALVAAAGGDQAALVGHDHELSAVPRV